MTLTESLAYKPRVHTHSKDCALGDLWFPNDCWSYSLREATVREEESTPWEELTEEAKTQEVRLRHMTFRLLAVPLTGGGPRDAWFQRAGLNGPNFQQQTHLQLWLRIS